MTDTVATYLAAAETSLALIAAPEVAARWDDDSVLPGMTVGALAAHLGRSITRPALFVDSPDPASASPVTGPQYYANFDGIDDRTSAVNQRVAATSLEESAPGHAGVLALLHHHLDHLRDVLPMLPAHRQVDALGNPMLVPEYLRTRILEFAVHVDDLALSVGLATPDLGPAAQSEAIGVLVEIARIKHGDLAVLRALARRERDHASALRVL